MSLRIADDLSLPVDAVTQAIAILARRGAGKTHTASVLVEEVVKARQPVVVLDPTGAWWGLRSSADGAHEGLPVVILGGEHGDIPLEHTAGKLIADLVVDHPGAFVLDLSAIESKTKEHAFVADFLERLYRAKAKHPEPLLVVVDEADGYAPQRPGSDQLRSLGALESIVRRGRIRGMGVVLITQRSAVLNKNVLTQIEVLIAMQTTGPQDRAAIDEWIKGNGTPDERDAVLGSLASLERGEAWVWSPAWLRILQRVRIRPRETFDSSKTPEAGQQSIEPRAFAKVDLEQLGERMRATAEKAKESDPAELRKRIRTLEAELASRPTEKVIETVTERVEVPVLNGQVEKLAELLGSMREIGSGLILVGTGIGETAASIADAIARVQTPHTTGTGRTQPGSSPRETSGLRGREGLTPEPVPVAPTRLPAPAPTGEGLAALKPTERAVLTALAQYPQGRTQQQTALLSGYSSTSGGYFAALARLRRDGFMEGTAANLRATDAGLSALGEWTPLPTGRELLDYWLGRLKPTERGVLTALLEVWPDTLTQTDVAARAGYSATSGGFFGALAKLRKLDLIQGTASGLRVTDDLGEHR